MNYLRCKVILYIYLNFTHSCKFNDNHSFKQTSTAIIINTMFTKYLHCKQTKRKQETTTVIMIKHELYFTQKAKGLYVCLLITVCLCVSLSVRETAIASVGVRARACIRISWAVSIRKISSPPQTSSRRGYVGHRLSPRVFSFVWVYSCFYLPPSLLPLLPSSPRLIPRPPLATGRHL